MPAGLPAVRSDPLAKAPVAGASLGTVSLPGVCGISLDFDTQGLRFLRRFDSPAFLCRSAKVLWERTSGLSGRSGEMRAGMARRSTGEPILNSDYGKESEGAFAPPGVGEVLRDNPRAASVASRGCDSRVSARRGAYARHRGRGRRGGQRDHAQGGDSGHGVPQGNRPAGAYGHGSAEERRQGVRFRPRSDRSLCRRRMGEGRRYDARRWNRTISSTVRSRR